MSRVDLVWLLPLIILGGVVAGAYRLGLADGRIDGAQAACPMLQRVPAPDQICVPREPARSARR